MPNNTKIKKGGLLIPNSASLFPLVKAVNKTLPVPQQLFTTNPDGTISAKTTPLFQDYANLATEVNMNGKKIGYYKLFPQTSSAISGGGQKKKPLNKNSKSKTKNKK